MTPHFFLFFPIIGNQKHCKSGRNVLKMKVFNDIFSIFYGNFGTDMSINLLGMYNLTKIYFEYMNLFRLGFEDL